MRCVVGILYKILLTVNSLSVFLVVYVVKSHLWLPNIMAWSVFFYAMLPVGLSAICLKVADYLGCDSVPGIKMLEGETEGNLSVYLGYFFVAVGIPNGDWITVGFIYILIFFFIFFSQIQYFNPIFLLFGYKFYSISKMDGLKIYIITKRRIKTFKGLEFKKLRRINDYTFIDKERY